MRTDVSRNRAGISADPTRVESALRMHPRRGIHIPVVSDVGDRADRREDVGTSLLVVECTADRIGDECAPFALPDPPIHGLHELRIKAYVHTHAHTLAHSI